MKQVYAAQNLPEAHMVKVFIESHDINAIVYGENLFNIHDSLPLPADTSPSVWVVEADFERAYELVEEFFYGEHDDGDADGGNWRCHGCGEILEAQFTECWNCGASRYLATDTPTE